MNISFQGKTLYKMKNETEAKRVLFLVDRGNLCRQAFKDFQQYGYWRYKNDVTYI